MQNPREKFRLRTKTTPADSDILSKCINRPANQNLQMCHHFVAAWLKSAAVPESAVCEPIRSVRWTFRCMLTTSTCQTDVSQSADSGTGKAWWVKNKIKKGKCLSPEGDQTCWAGCIYVSFPEQVCHSVFWRSIKDPYKKQANWWVIKMRSDVMCVCSWMKLKHLKEIKGQPAQWTDDWCEDLLCLWTAGGQQAGCRLG